MEAKELVFTGRTAAEARARMHEALGSDPDRIELVRSRQLRKGGFLGLGGTMGARHWYPDLDLHGDPRLDLSLHCPQDRMDLDFVEKLDPALDREEDPAAPASLAIHAIRRKEACFTESDKGYSIADPVECMLDLHELRLETQADSLYRFLESAKEQR